MTHNGKAFFHQYVPLIKAKALSRMIPRIFAQGAGVTLDLEDSVQDTLAPENTPALKAQARDGLRYLVEEHAGLFEGHAFNLRINDQDSGEYEHDLALLADIQGQIRLRQVWLPMVRGPQAMQRCFDDLRQRGYEQTQITPIMETLEGVRRLDEILAARDDYAMTCVHYGHYDYSLDAGHWPFLRQNTQAFWDIVHPIVRQTEAAGCTYIHTPLGELTNDELLLSVVHHLNETCRAPYGMTPLNFHQSQLNARPPLAADVMQTPSFTLAQRIEIAKQTIQTFCDHRVSKRSFSLKEGAFITPHEYRAALRFLDEHEGRAA